MPNKILGGVGGERIEREKNSRYIENKEMETSLFLLLSPLE
jgi:hypothetical protein